MVFLRGPRSIPTLEAIGTRRECGRARLGRTRVPGGIVAPLSGGRKGFARPTPNYPIDEHQIDNNPS